MGNKKSQTEIEIRRIGFSLQLSDTNGDSSKNDDVIVMAEKVRLSEVLKRELSSRTQIQVSRETGISKSLLNDWRSAKRLPNGKNLPQLRKLANYLGLTLEELLFDESPKGKTVLASTRFTDGGCEYRVNIEKVRE